MLHRKSRPWPLPQEAEGLFFPLPRALLRWMEVHAFPPPLAEASWQGILSFWEGKRVAVVRQAAYRGAYPSGGERSWPRLVLTAYAHLGPFSFLADLGADYFVVRQTPDPETYLWRQKFLNDPDPEKSFRAVQLWQEEQAGRNTLTDCEQIRWENYDLVVSLDIAVPSRIARQAKKTVWAYFSVEAGGALQKDSLHRPVPEYQLFLNHGFRRFRSRPRNRSHVLEFPFSFQSARSWARLTEEAGPPIPRRGTVVDKSTWNGLGKEELQATWAPISGNAREYVRQMSSAKFAVRIDPARRWGNWSIEAVQAGCLFLGNPDSLAMPALLLPDLAVQKPEEAQNILRRLEETPEQFASARQTQSLLAEHLAFRRPLAELTEKIKSVLKP